MAAAVPMQRSRTSVKKVRHIAFSTCRVAHHRYFEMLLQSPLCLQAQQQQLAKRRQTLHKPWVNLNGLDILLRNPLFIKLTLVLMLNGIVSEGLWEIMTQYLQLRLGFTTMDNVSACCAACLQALLCCLRCAAYVAVWFSCCCWAGYNRLPGPAAAWPAWHCISRPSWAPNVHVKRPRPPM